MEHWFYALPLRLRSLFRLKLLPCAMPCGPRTVPYQRLMFFLWSIT
jgi:hypothetical protein